MKQRRNKHEKTALMPALILTGCMTACSDDTFGEYLLTRSEYYDKMAQKYAALENDRVKIEKDKMTITMSENKTVLSLTEKIVGFEAKDDTIITDMSGSGQLKETPYRVERDILKLYPQEGTERILPRKK